jgi:hypothetical protein
MKGPYFIIGAPRSGTNMLRDVLVDSGIFVTWNCDEIDLVWRQGYYTRKDDVMTTGDFKKRIADKIVAKFRRLNRNNPGKLILEKTCANSLRIDYIRSIFPDAKFIFIHREIKDVVPSVVKKREKSFDWRYSFRKVYFSPVSTLALHLLQVFAKQLGIAKSNNLWGPRVPELVEGSNTKSPVEIAIIQWSYCMQSALLSLKKLDESSFKVIQYEKFVVDPATYLRDIASWSQSNLLKVDIDRSTRKVFRSSVGKSQNYWENEGNNDFDLMKREKSKVVKLIESAVSSNESE